MEPEDTAPAFSSVDFDAGYGHVPSDLPDDVGTRTPPAAHAASPSLHQSASMPEDVGAGATTSMDAELMEDGAVTGADDGTGAGAGAGIVLHQPTPAKAPPSAADIAAALCVPMRVLFRP